jgi:pimeloyl-ACP methyl ester carboxylesterase
MDRLRSVVAVDLPGFGDQTSRASDRLRPVRPLDGFLAALGIEEVGLGA